MAVIPTGAIYKSLVFDGEDSRNYGVYITGQAVYNAPERDVEMISIPGRNGSFALDKGRFQNIEVSYPAGIFADNETDFAKAISDFRNLLCSRNGYVRLSDEYHPDEYRMAVYKSGLEVEPAQLKAGEFNIVFDCKPQRYLLSGEEAIDVTSGEVILNPTLFESSPMLEVEGYGNIQFNGYEIELNDGPMGDTVVREKASYSNKPRLYSDTFEITSLMANSGDNGTIGTSTYIAYCPLNYRNGDSYSIGSTTVRDYAGATAVPELIEGNILRLTVTIPNASFVVGTNFSNHGTVAQTVTRTRDGASEDGQFYFGFGLRQRDNVVRWNVGNFDELTTTQVFKPATGYCGCTEGAIIINSTVSILGQPTYIDCDLGEAYKMSGADIFSLNPYIDLGSDLPTLASGTNTFTFDNTITDLKVIPRWWKI